MRIRCLVRTVGVFLLVVCGVQQAIGQSRTEARKREAAGQGMIYLSREEILDGAKKEGNLLVYPGVDEKAIPPLVSSFKKKYPFLDIKYGIVTGVPAIQRQMFEMVAGKANLDVFHAHTGFRGDYIKNNLYKKYDFGAMVEDGHLKVPPRAIDEGGGFILSGANLGVLLYNTTLVPAEKAPTSWESCLDPQWKGKFAVDTRPYLLARLAARWSEEKILDYAAKLKTNDPVWTRGHTTSLERLITGELSLICGISMHVWLRKAKTDPTVPVKMVVPNPLGVAFFESHAVYTQAKNPNAALLWVEFFASKDGQDIVESLEPGRASFLVEGTAANKITKDANVSLCVGVCRDREEKLIERVAVEAWKFPKVGYTPK
jgi:iron(III) transport system substrate-binding protein